MAEKLMGEFNHEALEASIARLAQEIKNNREQGGGTGTVSPEEERTDRSGQEEIKNALRALTPTYLTTPKQDTTTEDPLAKYTEGAPAETKLEIEYLVDLTLHKGVEVAMKEARDTSPYVLDAFHDALIGVLYPELKKRGIVE